MVTVGYQCGPAVQTDAGGPASTGGGSSGIQGNPASQVEQIDLGTELFDSFCGGINWSPGCLPDQAQPVAAPPAPPQPPQVTVTPGMVQQAFQQIPLPPSVLRIQPPDGETLVNFETNFYTDAAAFDRSVTLLGQSVDLRLYPVAYTWVHGDGTSATGDDPGAPYPDLRVTHVYEHKGRVTPRVDVTWAADYRLPGTPWRPVDGTVTVPGTPQPLRVLEAQPNLVG